MRAFTFRCSLFLLCWIYKLMLSNMPASPEREKALSLFVDAIREDSSLQNNLNLLASAEDLKAFVDNIDSSITGQALIPHEQATSPPKITVDSGILEANIPWRLLRCPGGPLVLQMICSKINFALWIETC